MDNVQVLKLDMGAGETDYDAVLLMPGDKYKAWGDFAPMIFAMKHWQAAKPEDNYDVNAWHLNLAYLYQLTEEGPASPGYWQSWDLAINTAILYDADERLWRLYMDEGYNIWRISEPGGGI